MAQDLSAITHENSIFYEIVSCKEVYKAEKSLMKVQGDDFAEICTILSGNGGYYVFNQVIPCKEGDIFVTSPSVPHKFFSENINNTLKLRKLKFRLEDWLDASVCKENTLRYCYGVFKENTATAYAALNAHTRELINKLYDAIEQELIDKKNNWQDLVRSYLVQFFVIIERYTGNSIKNNVVTSPKKWNIALKVMRIVESDYKNADLTLELIAKQLYICKSNLSNIFLEMTGMTFTKYLKDVRLKRACQLLSETRMTVEEIVNACGLNDVATFYKNFASCMNMTPKEYRQSFVQVKQSENNIKILKGKKEMTVLREISEQLQKGKAKIVQEMVQKALDEGAKPEQILNEGLLAGMNIIGEKFKNNEIYVPEVLVAARAMNMGAQILKPHLAANGVTSIGRVCIGTVQGDLHDIGKNLVKMMMEGKGLEVIDLGTDVAPETFVQVAKEKNCKVICCSALLTTTMSAMAEVVKCAVAEGIRDKVKIMIGGAPLNEEFCREIGADCYTSDAASAANAAADFCKA